MSSLVAGLRITPSWRTQNDRFREESARPRPATPRSGTADGQRQKASRRPCDGLREGAPAARERLGLPARLGPRRSTGAGFNEPRKPCLCAGGPRPWATALWCGQQRHSDSGRPQTCADGPSVTLRLSPTCSTGQSGDPATPAPLDRQGASSACTCWLGCAKGEAMPTGSGGSRCICVGRLGAVVRRRCPLRLLDDHPAVGSVDQAAPRRP